MTPAALRAEEVLLQAPNPMDLTKLSIEMGIRRTSMLPIMAWLREKYGNRLVKRREGSRNLYLIKKDGAEPVPMAPKPGKQPMPKVNVLEDLWRGWANPVTGYVPGRLG